MALKPVQAEQARWLEPVTEVLYNGGPEQSLKQQRLPPHTGKQPSPMMHYRWIQVPSLSFWGQVKHRKWDSFGENAVPPHQRIFDILASKLHIFMDS